MCDRDSLPQSVEHRHVDRMFESFSATSSTEIGKMDPRDQSQARKKCLEALDVLASANAPLRTAF